MPQVIIDVFLLFLGFFYTFFLPGFLIIESFFKKIPKLIKIPLYILLSGVASTFWIYLVSLFSGYLRATILLSLIPFLVWLLIYVFNYSGFKIPKFPKYACYYLGAIATFLIFFITLYFSFFYNDGQNIILAGDNWQDGAMHLSISESISQGNFPPLTPYMSGKPLHYYFFADFQSSILEVLYGNFFPRSTVFINSLYAGVLFLSVYALSHLIFKDRKTSLISATLAVFGGNLMILRFIDDFLNTSMNSNILKTLALLLANKTYVAEYPKIMQVNFISNYLFQNRPMSFGLPVFICLVFLIILAIKRKQEKYILLAGIVTALMFKFQMFVGLTVIFVTLLCLLAFLASKQLKNFLKFGFTFAFSVGLILILEYFIFPVDKNFFENTFLSNFHFGSWDGNKELWWYLEFALMNFNVFIIFPIIFTIAVIFRRINIHSVFAILLSTALFSIYLLPHLVTFTIYQPDMFKFFALYFILAAIPTGYVFSILFNKKLLKVFTVLLIFFVCTNSLLDIGNNFFNKNVGYSLSDVEVGNWIRVNTKQKSIFITFDTIHSPVSDIAGRLRVMGYVNWPYTHGYNSGSDNVFARLKDIDDIYNNIDNPDLIIPLVRKYNANYIYWGPDEKNQYPRSKYLFANSKYLQKVYSNGDTSIYKVTI